MRGSRAREFTRRVRYRDRRRNASRWRSVAQNAPPRDVAVGLVFPSKAGNKPAGTADDPTAPGPYDAICKKIRETPAGPLPLDPQWCHCGSGPYREKLRMKFVIPSDLKNNVIVGCFFESSPLNRL